LVEALSRPIGSSDAFKRPRFRCKLTHCSPDSYEAARGLVSGGRINGREPWDLGRGGAFDKTLGDAKRVRAGAGEYS
jgi:hypothetical protein